MSDKEKTIISLALLKETCDAALTSVAAADGVVPDDLAHLQTADFAVIHKDFVSLLAYLYSATTKTAISLKPSSPTYSASLSPLKDLSTNISNLSHNVRLVQKAHGATVLKELQSAARSVISAIQGLTETLLSDTTATKEPSDVYLSKVGEVHDAIDKLRSGTDELSSNNVTAVRKIWTADQSSLSDALRELQEIPESGDDNDFDDGWDELGIDSSSNKLSPGELERLRKVESIVKLCNLMHKTVVKRVFSAPLQNAPVQQEINSIVDILANDSPTLPAAVDDLIATVYSPQDKEEMLDQLHHLDGVIDRIKSHIDSLFALEPVGDLLKEATGTGKKDT
ncbi:hypothetical protein H1R20_g5765, partial [Candolleomyces eurysporus]